MITIARWVPVAATLAVCSVTGPGRAGAQEGASPAGYTAFLATGLSTVSTRQLNDRLAANGHPTFERSSLALNVGAYRLLRSGVMLGGEWHFLGLGDGRHQGREVGLGAGYATVGIARAITLSPRMRFYPRLGLGVGGMGLWAEEPDSAAGGNVDFDQWLATPGSDPSFATLSQGSMVVDLGAGAEIVLGCRERGPLLGLRAGYVATPFDQGWTRNGREVAGAPRATVAGAYIRLIMGWRHER